MQNVSDANYLEGAVYLNKLWEQLKIKQSIRHLRGYFRCASQLGEHIKALNAYKVMLSMGFEDNAAVHK